MLLARYTVDMAKKPCRYWVKDLISTFLRPSQPQPENLGPGGTVLLELHIYAFSMYEDNLA